VAIGIPSRAAECPAVTRRKGLPQRSCEPIVVTPLGWLLSCNRHRRGIWQG